MRIGERSKTRRGETAPPRADAKGKPKFAAAGSVVGQLSPDIISTYFAPELIFLAKDVLETYSDDLLQYNDAIREAEKNEDGSYSNESDVPSPPQIPLYQSQYWIDQLEETLTDTADFFHSKTSDWKIQANAARFERRMDEKYGMFRPFLKEHPEVERMVRSVQRRYAQGYYSPFRQGKPPIPKSTAVIILFMMQRGSIHWHVTLFAVLFFLIGLQPWALVVLVAGGSVFFERRKLRPQRPMKRFIPSTDPYYAVEGATGEVTEEEEDDMKKQMLLRPVGTKLGAGEKIDGSEYDTIILGYGTATLYTAALLSRAGRKVIVLSNRSDASGCYQIESAPDAVMKAFKDVPFDVDSMSIGRLSKQQDLLCPAISSSSDAQGGVRFAKIGSAADGYAFQILKVPGMGVSSGEEGSPFVLRADGVVSLMEQAALELADGWPGLKGERGNSTTGAYVAACDAVNSTANQFYMAKILSEKFNSLRKDPTYYDMAIRYASTSLNKGFPVNSHTRSIMAAIGMTVENIKPSMTSMGTHVTNICAAMSGEGMHYPVGGPRALCHALAAVVEQSGGRIVTEAPISSLVFEEETLPRPTRTGADGKEEEIPPACVGVKLTDGRDVTLDTSKWTAHSPAVISMHGLVTTFIRLLPEDIRAKYKVPRGLPALSERRPLFKIMFALSGSADELELTGADYYRLPGAALAQDEFDQATGMITQGEIGWVDDTDGDDTNMDAAAVNEDEETEDANNDSQEKRSKAGLSAPKKRRREKFETGMSWMRISFPSAKDPSFESRHGKVSTCIVEIEADDDFVTAFDTKPKLFVIKKDGGSKDDYQRLVERVRKDVLENYPQLAGTLLEHVGKSKRNSPC